MYHIALLNEARYKLSKIYCAPSGGQLQLVKDRSKIYGTSGHVAAWYGKQRSDALRTKRFGNKATVTRPKTI